MVLHCFYNLLYWPLLMFLHTFKLATTYVFTTYYYTGHYLCFLLCRRINTAHFACTARKYTVTHMYIEKQWDRANIYSAAFVKRDMQVNIFNIYIFPVNITINCFASVGKLPIYHTLLCIRW